MVPDDAADEADRLAVKKAADDAAAEAARLRAKLQTLYPEYKRLLVTLKQRDEELAAVKAQGSSIQVGINNNNPNHEAIELKRLNDELMKSALDHEGTMRELQQEIASQKKNLELNSDAKRQLDAVNVQLSSITELYAQLQEQSAVSAQFQQKQAIEIENLRDQLNDADSATDQKVESFTNHIAELETSLAQNRQEIERLEDELGSSSRMCAEMQQKLERSITVQQDQAEEVKRLQDELLRMDFQQEENISDMQSRAEALEFEVQSRKEIDALEDEIATAAKRYAQLEQKLVLSSAAQSKQVEEIGSLREQLRVQTIHQEHTLSAVQTKSQALEEDAREAFDELRQASSKCQELEQNLLTVNTSYAEVQVQLELVSQNYQEKVVEVDRLQGELKQLFSSLDDASCAAKTRIMDLEVKLQDTVDELDRISQKRSSDDLELEMASINGRCLELENELNTSSEVQADQANTIDQLRRELQKANSKHELVLANAQAKIEELEDSLAANIATISELERKVKEISQQRKNLQVELQRSAVSVSEKTVALEQALKRNSKQQRDSRITVQRFIEQSKRNKSLHADVARTELELNGVLGIQYDQAKIIRHSKSLVANWSCRYAKLESRLSKTLGVVSEKDSLLREAEHQRSLFSNERQSLISCHEDAISSREKQLDLLAKECRALEEHLSDLGSQLQSCSSTRDSLILDGDLLEQENRDLQKQIDELHDELSRREKSSPLSNLQCENCEKLIATMASLRRELSDLQLSSIDKNETVDMLRIELQNVEQSAELQVAALVGQITTLTSMYSSLPSSEPSVSDVAIGPDDLQYIDAFTDADRNISSPQSEKSSPETIDSSTCMRDLGEDYLSSSNSDDFAQLRNQLNKAHEEKSRISAKIQEQHQNSKVLMDHYNEIKVLNDKLREEKALLSNDLDCLEKIVETKNEAVTHLQQELAEQNSVIDELRGQRTVMDQMKSGPDYPVNLESSSQLEKVLAEKDSLILELREQIAVQEAAAREELESSSSAAAYAAKNEAFSQIEQELMKKNTQIIELQGKLAAQEAAEQMKSSSSYVASPTEVLSSSDSIRGDVSSAKAPVIRTTKRSFLSWIVSHIPRRQLYDDDGKPIRRVDLTEEFEFVWDEKLKRYIDPGAPPDEYQPKKPPPPPKPAGGNLPVANKALSSGLGARFALPASAMAFTDDVETSTPPRRVPLAVPPVAGKRMTPHRFVRGSPSPNARIAPPIFSAPSPSQPDKKPDLDAASDESNDVPAQRMRHSPIAAPSRRSSMISVDALSPGPAPVLPVRSPSSLIPKPSTSTESPAVIGSRPPPIRRPSTQFASRRAPLRPAATVRPPLQPTIPALSTSPINRVSPAAVPVRQSDSTIDTRLSSSSSHQLATPPAVLHIRSDQPSSPQSSSLNLNSISPSPSMEDNMSLPTSTSELEQLRAQRDSLLIEIKELQEQLTLIAQQRDQALAALADARSISASNVPVTEDKEAIELLKGLADRLDRLDRASLSQSPAVFSTSDEGISIILSSGAKMSILMIIVALLIASWANSVGYINI